MLLCRPGPLIFFFNDTATTEIYTLSLHDALPILVVAAGIKGVLNFSPGALQAPSDVKLKSVDLTVSLESLSFLDRKSTRLNSSHSQISYAVFCLKKKN